MKYVLFIFLLIITSHNLLICVNLNSDIDDKIEEGIISLRYEDVFNSDIDIIAKDTLFYLPINSVLNLLKINFNYDFEKKVIKGFFIEQDSLYEINFKEKVILLNDKQSYLSEEDFKIYNNEVYVKPEIFDSIFKFKVNVKYSKLSAEINSKNDLPIKREIIRKKQFSFLRKYQMENFDFPLLFDRRRSWLNGLILSYKIFNTYTPLNNYFSLNTNFGAEILGGDFQSILFYNKNFKTNIENSYLQSRWRYYIKENEYLTQVILGNQYHYGYRISYLPLLNFNGIQLTNEKTQIPTSFETIQIKERIEQGWLVELYSNGIFINQSISDGSGYFEFNLPLNYGSSNIELRYYGKNGEFFSKKEVFLIPYEFLKPNELKYSLSIGQDITSLSNIGDLKISYGFSRWLTNTLNINYNLSINKLSLRNELSFKVFSNFFITYDYFHQELSKLILNYYTYNSGSYKIIHTWNTHSNNFMQANIITNTAFYFSIPMFLRGMSLSLNGNINNNKNDINSSLSANLYSFLFPYYATISYMLINNIDKKDKIVDYRHNIYGSFGVFFINNTQNSFWGSFKVTFDPSFNISDNKINYLGATFTQTLAQNYVLNFIYRYDFFSKMNSVLLNLRVDFNFLRSNSEFSLNNSFNSYNQQIDGSIAFDSDLKNVKFTNPTFISNIGNSAVCFRVFIDLNNNGKFDSDFETIVPDVNIQITNSRIETDNKSGYKYAFSLIPYSLYNVKLDPKSIKNPNFVPKFTEFSFIADPNVIKPIDIPVLVTGIIEGTVLRERDGKREGQAGVKIHIMSEDSSYHETQPVFSDGSFYKMGLMPGNYLAWVDSLQCAILDVYQQDTIKRFTVKSTKTGDFIEGLDFVLLDRKEKDKKKVVIETISTPIVPEEEIKIDTLVNGYGKIDDRKPTKKLTDSKFDSKDGVPNVLLLYKESKWTWLSVPMQKELDKVAKYLIENPNAKAQIDGHSDNFGTMDENMKVSEQRVKEVVNYLYRKGISLSRLYSSGHGALYPVGDNKTAQGRAKNRRVEVKIIE